MGYHVQYKGHREIREKKFTEAAHKQDQGHRDRFLLHFLRFFHRRKHEKLRDVSKFHPHVRPNLCINTRNKLFCRWFNIEFGLAKATEAHW